MKYAKYGDEVVCPQSTTPGTMPESPFLRGEYLALNNTDGNNVHCHRAVDGRDPGDSIGTQSCGLSATTRHEPQKKHYRGFTSTVINTNNSDEQQSAFCTYLNNISSQRSQPSRRTSSPRTSRPSTPAPSAARATTASAASNLSATAASTAITVTRGAILLQVCDASGDSEGK